MQVQMGNETPHAAIVDHDQPCVYYWSVPDEAGYTHAPDDRPHGTRAGIHVLSNETTHLPEHECFVSVVSDWPNHSPKPPTWVWSDDPDLAEMLAEFYDCPVGIPPDVEDTHHTKAGPPGVAPAISED